MISLSAVLLFLSLLLLLGMLSSFAALSVQARRAEETVRDQR